MIVCPNCKEEIEDDSNYCDQCGQPLAYCERCGRVGVGRRCTSCGGRMLSAEEYKKAAQNNLLNSSLSTGFVSQQGMASLRTAAGGTHRPTALPQLVLHNDSLGIRVVGINGAVIGRRQGPYVQYFQQHGYISGVHAQLKYNPVTGWCIADKHSSNGTKLNDHQLQPDVEMSLKNGDILSIANVVLKVTIN